ncbi:hypothetical protein Tco_1441676 [Tanacetum coccineum]
MFNTIRVISKHQDIQKRTAPATKGSRLKTSTKAAKSVKKKQPAKKPITKGLTVLSEVTLSEAEQLKLAIKRSKIQFHSSHVSGSSDGADPQSEIPDEQQQKVGGTNEGAGDDDDDDNDNYEHDLEDEKDDEDDDDKNDKEKEEEKSDDDDEVYSDHKVSTPPNHELTEEEENQEGDDYVREGEQEDAEDELYRDLNINLESRGAEMIDAHANQDTEDVYFINPSLDTGIDSILNPNIQSDTPVNVSASVAAVTPSTVTTSPQPPVLIIQTVQQTPDSTTTTPNPTTTLTEIPNFASLFGFE